jgi:short subunit dehydrogenase-like uncharacterized protein
MTNALQPRWLLYGASGYTGRLVAAEAVARGVPPILAGRSPAPVHAVGRQLGLPVRVFPLDDGAATTRALEGVEAVLHCAGPFVWTSRPMLEACLAAGVHYLDVTGEIPVFEAVLARGEQARERGIAVVPGVGFDVVPTDCLAARLAAALPGANRLELAFAASGGGWSAGTMRTMIELLPLGGAERRDGRIVPVPAAAFTRRINFTHRRLVGVSIPWGDVSTAFHTTGIPSVRVYLGLPAAAARRLRRLVRLAPVLRWTPLRRSVQWLVARVVRGPDQQARATGRSYLWGEVRNGEGSWVQGRLVTPEGYALTAAAAVECVRRVLAGAVPAGAWTPAQAFGPALVEQLPGVQVEPLIACAPAAGAGAERAPRPTT